MGPENVVLVVEERSQYRRRLDGILALAVDDLVVIAREREYDVEMLDWLDKRPIRLKFDWLLERNLGVWKVTGTLYQLNATNNREILRRRQDERNLVIHTKFYEERLECLRNTKSRLISIEERLCKLDERITNNYNQLFPKSLFGEENRLEKLKRDVDDLKSILKVPVLTFGGSKSIRCDSIEQRLTTLETKKDKNLDLDFSNIEKRVNGKFELFGKERKEFQKKKDLVNSEAVYKAVRDIIKGEYSEYLYKKIFDEVYNEIKEKVVKDVTEKVQKKEEDIITIRLKEQCGEETYFKLRTTTKMSKVFDAFAKRKRKHLGHIIFLLDGERVNFESTPHELDLDENDKIDCIIEQPAPRCSMSRCFLCEKDETDTKQDEGEQKGDNCSLFDTGFKKSLEETTKQLKEKLSVKEEK
jgi:small ubiquitin-related modifier